MIRIMHFSDWYFSVESILSSILYLRHCNQCITVQFTGFITPTPVQKAVIPRLLNGENLVMAASTGSGKTLAFTLPVIQTLISQEQQVIFSHERERSGKCLLPSSSSSVSFLPTNFLVDIPPFYQLLYHYRIFWWFIIPWHLRLSTDYFLISVRIHQGYARQVRRPRCIILVPTRDLARQILSNIKDLSHFSKVSFYHMTIFHPSVLFSLFLLKPSSMFALLTTALSSAQWRKSHLIWTTWSISLKRGMSRVDFISFVQDCSALSISLSLLNITGYSIPLLLSHLCTSFFTFW